MQDKVFLISNAATKRIEYLIDKNNYGPDTRLRIKVDGGGCSGFQYSFDFDTKLDKDDFIFKKDTIEIIIDSISMNFLNNAKLDYIDELGAASFKIKNPNATAACGCGNSFSVNL